MMRFALVAFFLLFAREASATPPKRNAVSYEPLSIAARGISIQYERLLLRKLSIVGGVGARRSSRGDYSSTVLSLRSEARWWLVAHEGWSGLDGMVGMYLGGGVDLARTSVHDRVEDRDIGSSYELDESLTFGYRFVAFGFQEITPYLGLLAVHDFDESGRLASNTRFTGEFGFTVGWMF